MIKLFNDKIDLNIMFDELNKKHFDDKITKIPCYWNDKMRVCAGKCVYKKSYNAFKSADYYPIKIELSYKLFKNNNMDMEKITNTMIHEMCHAYLVEHFNERGHTARFQSLMTKITGVSKNHRCHNYNVEGLRNERKIAYSCECGLAEGTRSRMPKAGVTYTARCCGSIVKFYRKS